MRVRFLMAAVVLAALPAIAVAAPQEETKIVIQSSSKTDEPKKGNAATSKAEAVAALMSFTTAAELTKAYPCTSSLTTRDLGALLDHQRQREELGSNDSVGEVDMAKTGGARYLVDIVVTQYGGRTTVNVSMWDMRTRKAIARDITTVPPGGVVVEAVDAFAKKFVGGLAGTVPACPGPWKGTVTITTTSNAHGVKPGAGPWKSESTLTVTCSVTKLRGDADCAVTYDSSVSGNGASLEQHAGGSSSALVTGSVTLDMVSVSVSQVQVKGTQTAMGIAMPETYTFGPWGAKARPTSSGIHHSKGKWTEDDTTITWDLSRQ